MKKTILILVMLVTVCVFALCEFVGEETPFSEVTVRAPIEEKELDFGGTAIENGKVNINTASLAALCTLDGIGRAYAERIIDFRTNKRSFETIEDIMLVTGIGEKRFLEIKDKISVK